MCFFGRNIYIFTLIIFFCYYYRHQKKKQRSVDNFHAIIYQKKYFAKLEFFIAGASHLDDLIYLFHFPKFPLFKETDPESSMIEKMTMMWSNFVVHGYDQILISFALVYFRINYRVPIKEPCELLDNVKWDPYTQKTQSYMDIGNKLVLNEKLLEKRYEQWRKLYPMSKYSAAKMG